MSLQYQSGPCATGNRYIPEFSKAEFETLVSNKLNGGQHSGSTLLVFDSNGDGKNDLLIGDIGCNNMYLLVNNESNSNPIFTQFFRYYPATDPILVENFPAAFFIDVNNDNKRDLIAVPNTTGNADNFDNIKLYLNQGTDAAPDFELTTQAFLEEFATSLSAADHVFLCEIFGSIRENTGELTIQDILNELKKPGLDPRSEAQAFEFANIFSIDDVKVGMEVPGVVTNITRFGAFVDIGVKQDGLVSIKQMLAPATGLQKRSIERKNSVVQKEAELPMNDALVALKQKFGR